MRKLIFLLVVLIVPGVVSAADMTSTNYIIRNDAISAGGDTTSSSGSYIVRDTIGQSAIGNGSSDAYIEQSGRSAAVFDQVAGFSTYLQNRTTQVGVTALSSTTFTATSTTDFSVGDKALLVQDELSSPVFAFGEVISVVDGDITVDGWTSSGAMPIIDCFGDRAYVLDATSLDFGTLTVGAVARAIIAMEVDSDNDDGFNIYIGEGGGLTNGAYEIADVVDGAVSAGVDEYGARSSDASITDSTFDTEDTAITNTYQKVAEGSGATLSARAFLDLKVGISSAATSGTYSHAITLVYVGDF
ncbi:MAG: hypothetical protein O3B96_02135 [bacterium]|nr:hypothetical protein [bacterium]